VARGALEADVVQVHGVIEVAERAREGLPANSLVAGEAVGVGLLVMAGVASSGVEPHDLLLVSVVVRPVATGAVELRVHDVGLVLEPAPENAPLVGLDSLMASKTR
jgi:hypothetical protein